MNRSPSSIRVVSNQYDMLPLLDGVDGYDEEDIPYSVKVDKLKLRLNRHLTPEQRKHFFSHLGT